MRIQPIAARLRVLAVTSILLAVSHSASSDDASARSQSALQTADRMIAACLAHAASAGLPPLSIVVVDAAGALIAFKRQDGAMPVSGEAAMLKARTAVRTNVPTALLGPLASQDPVTRDAFLMLQLSGIPGGVPFAQGAVGVSGATADQDAGCAQHAVDAITRGHSK